MKITIVGAGAIQSQLGAEDGGPVCLKALGEPFDGFAGALQAQLLEATPWA